MNLIIKPNKFIRFLMLLLFPMIAFPFAPGGFFQQFPNRYFIETGTWEGHGVLLAVMANCFQEIHTIELAETFYTRNKIGEMNHSNPPVHVWYGDSGIVLGDVLKGINEPATIWLDAHYSGNDTARGESNTPILRELECIKNHPIKTHTILIDDIRLFGTPEFDNIPLDTIISKLKEINPSYKISIKDGLNSPKDILVAKPKKSKKKNTSPKNRIFSVS